MDKIIVMLFALSFAFYSSSAVSHDGPVDENGCHIEIVDGKANKHCHK